MQAVEQVFAEPALAHQHTQIARSGRDDAHIKRHQLVAAQRLDLALLQRPQQLGLQTLRHVANFVEEQRAAIGQLELAIAPLAVGPGVGAGGHAEEFGFKQRVGHRCDVDADKGTTGAAGRSVDGVRQQFFARARFTQQQHRAARLRSTPRLALDLGRCGAGADEAGKGVFGAALSITRHSQRAAALAGQLAPGVVQVALQQRKFADEGL